VIWPGSLRRTANAQDLAGILNRAVSARAPQAGRGMSEDQMISSGVAIGAVAGCVLAAAVLSGCTGDPPPPPAVGSSDLGSAPPTPAQTTAAGSVPDDQALLAFTAPDHSYTVKVPKDWAPATAGSKLRFTDRLDSITISPRTGFYQPTENYARSVEVLEIATEVKGSLGEVTTVQRHAGPAILITYREQPPPGPVAGSSVALKVERFEFAKPGSGDGVVLTLSAPASSDNVTPWRLITDSFGWLS
jgi:hypothetical protein